jgi:hypothetical protein
MGLEGKELLAKLDELGDSATKEEQMLASGYFTLRKDGTKRLAQSQFYIALMDARSAKTRLERASTANQEENNIQQTHPPESSEEAKASTDEVKVSVYGLGVMICLYEISEDDFDRFKQLSEDGELDHDDLEIGPDHGDQVAAYFEPSLMVSGEEVNEEISLERLGATVHSCDESIAPPGSFWSLSIESYKGVWGSINAPLEKAKDLSNYVVHKTRVVIGDGASFDPLEIATVSFMDDEYGELNEHELEGKSVDWYLVDKSGEVYSV